MVGHRGGRACTNQDAGGGYRGFGHRGVKDGAMVQLNAVDSRLLWPIFGDFCG